MTRRQALEFGAVVLGGLAVGQVLRRTAPVGREVRDAAAVAAILNDPSSPVEGPAGASLRMAVFGDYRCPACRDAFPAMEAAVRADGDVRVVYKDWPIFGAVSERAARVALATVAQGIYPAVHRRLMTTARVLDDGLLREVVTGAGGDWARVRRDLAEDGARIGARIAENGRQALAIGLAGTPGYLAGAMLVNGGIDEGAFGRLFARAREG